MSSLDGHVLSILKMTGRRLPAVRGRSAGGTSTGRRVGIRSTDGDGAGAAADAAAQLEGTCSHASHHVHPGRPGEDVGRRGGVLTHGGLGHVGQRPAAALDPVEEGVELDAPGSAVELDVIVPLRGL